MKKHLLAMLVAVIYHASAICQEVDSIVALYANQGIYVEISERLSIKETPGHWADLRGEIDSLELMYKAIDPYNQTHRKDNPEKSDNASFFWAIALATVKNLSKEELPKITPLPAEGISKDFNADLGFICLFTPRNTVTTYKHAFIIGLHKSGNSDFFIMLSSDDLERLKQSLSTSIFGKIKYQ